MCLLSIQRIAQTNIIQFLKKRQFELPKRNTYK